MRTKSSETNLGHTAWEWAQVIAGLRRQCSAFAVASISPHCEVSASWLDDHSVELRWSRGNVWRNLLISLEGETPPVRVHLSGSAYVEPPRGPQDFQWWRSETVAEVGAPAELEQVMESYLPAAYQALTNLMPSR